mmetsp:Transcript_77511/g.250910  ORF Transcript_77511/g.250910 Transcript_77511/m.250910 type:complete len:331 (-) Transcript_77511:1473-2465(-)
MQQANSATVPDVAHAEVVRRLEQAVGPGAHLRRLDPRQGERVRLHLPMLAALHVALSHGLRDPREQSSVLPPFLQVGEELAQGVDGLRLERRDRRQLPPRWRTLPLLRLRCLPRQGRRRTPRLRWRGKLGGSVYHVLVVHVLACVGVREPTSSLFLLLGALLLLRQLRHVLPAPLGRRLSRVGGRGRPLRGRRLRQDPPAFVVEEEVFVLVSVRHHRMNPGRRACGLVVRVQARARPHQRHDVREAAALFRPVLSLADIWRPHHALHGRRVDAEDLYGDGAEGALEKVRHAAQLLHDRLLKNTQATAQDVRHVLEIDAHVGHHDHLQAPE